jgi:hypothetical protein
MELPFKSSGDKKKYGFIIKIFLKKNRWGYPINFYNTSTRTKKEIG